MFSLLNLSCGFGCGGPFSYNPSPGIEIWLDKNYESDNSIEIKLIEPKVYYRIESKTELPLLVNYERMVFEISKNDTILDSLIINYKMSAVYLPDNVCEDEKYKPFVEIKSSYSTSNYFKYSYSAINKMY